MSRVAFLNPKPNSSSCEGLAEGVSVRPTCPAPCNPCGALRGLGILVVYVHPSRSKLSTGNPKPKTFAET